MSDQPDNSNNTESSGADALVKTLKVSFNVLRVLLLLVLIAFLFSNATLVDQGNDAYVLRFGKLMKSEDGSLLNSGEWYWSWPNPVDKVVQLPARSSIKVSTEDHFWYSKAHAKISETQLEGKGLIPGVDGYLVTSDASILHLRVSAEFKISDLLKYDFTCKNSDPKKPNEMLQLYLNTAVLEEASAHTLSDILKNSNEFTQAVRERLAKRIDRLDLGVIAEQVSIAEKSVPRAVKRSQQKLDVVSQTISSYKLAKEKEARQILIIANNRRRSINDDTTNYTETEKKRAEAASKYFSQLLKAYEENPETALLALRTEKLVKVMENVEEIFVLDAPDGEKQTQLNLKLSRDKQQDKKDNKKDE